MRNMSFDSYELTGRTILGRQIRVSSKRLEYIESIKPFMDTSTLWGINKLDQRVPLDRIKDCAVDKG